LVCRAWAIELATIDPSTKTEISISTHYEDMKGDTKCGNGVVGDS